MIYNFNSVFSYRVSDLIMLNTINMLSACRPISVYITTLYGNQASFGDTISGTEKAITRSVLLCLVQGVHNIVTCISFVFVLSEIPISHASFYGTISLFFEVI